MVSTSDLAPTGNELLENEVHCDSQDLFVDESHDSPQNMQLIDTSNNDMIETPSGVAEPTI